MLELIGTTALMDSLRCTREPETVCMTGIIGNKWWFDTFSPMKVIPAAVTLTTYSGEAMDFMRTPLQELLVQIAKGALHVQVGPVFRLDDIVELTA